MVERKGIGYIIEAMTALLVMFIFILGNSPSDPGTNWNQFQKQAISQDITYTLEKTGDTEDFIRNGETGSLVTAAETLSRGRVSVSGSIENVPISTQVVGFHVLENNRDNVSLDSVQDLGDQCYQDDDLEEINAEDGDILRSENSRAGAYLYVADTDPEISGGDGSIDYDTVWVDNKTRCQFSSSEGPYYIGEFIYWGDGPGGENWDINEIYSSSENLELYLATQIVDMKGSLKSRVNGIDTGLVLDTVASEQEDLGSYDILIFRTRDSLPVLNSEEEKLQDFMSHGSMLLMIDLEKQDFYNGNTPADNFITNTGLKWVDLPYRSQPPDPTGVNFHSSSHSEVVQTYFQGQSGNDNGVDLKPSGNVTSSNNRFFKNSEPLVTTGGGAYKVSEWNATNYSMEQADPNVIEGYPETACVDSTKSSSLTNGTFEFYDYQTDDIKVYDVINTELGEDEEYCNNNDVRALNIDLNDNGDFGDPGEGPFLNGESLMVENKSFTATFPSDQAVQTGEAAVFIYTGESAVENVNYRTSFRDFTGRKLARIGYENNYETEDKKVIASLLHWLSEDTAQYGVQEDTVISTETVGGVKEETFIPYRISMRWR